MGAIKSFAFLSEQYVMRAWISSSVMCLDVFDLESAFEDNALCSFRFPVGPAYTEMSIRCDVTSGRTSHSHGSVPFSTSQSDRLYVVSCATDRLSDPHRVLLVHLSTLLAKISTLPPGTKGHQFTWAQWGEGAGSFSFQRSISITHIHGTKFALIRNQQLEVYDLNKLSVKRNRVRRRSNTKPINPYLLGDEFVGAAYSSLLYDMCAIPISDRVNPNAIRSVLLTEDNLILIPVSEEHSMFGKCTSLTDRLSSMHLVEIVSSLHFESKASTPSVVPSISMLITAGPPLFCWTYAYPYRFSHPSHTRLINDRRTLIPSSLPAKIHMTCLDTYSNEAKVGISRTSGAPF
jgi:hypothetical protein